MDRHTEGELARRRKEIEARRGPPPAPGTVPPPARFPREWIAVEPGEHFAWRVFATNIAELPPYCSDPRCRRARLPALAGPVPGRAAPPWYQPLLKPYMEWLDWLQEEGIAHGKPDR